MKTLFTGSDVLYLRQYHPLLKRRWIFIFFFRLFIRLCDLILESHYCVSQRLADELKLFGLKKPIQVIEWQPLHKGKFERMEHEGINIMYRKFTSVRNQNFYDWLTSYDIFLKLKSKFNNINFIEIDDSHNLKDIFPLIDGYIRFNRWDGGDPPRLVRECINSGVPTYFTIGEPDINKISDFITNI